MVVPPPQACEVEQSKALLGHCSAVLSAMQMVKDHDRQVAEGEDKGEELLALFGDGKGPRTTRLEVLVQRVKESLVRAEEEEEVAKKMVTETRQQASGFKGVGLIILLGNKRWGFIILQGRALSFC